MAIPEVLNLLLIAQRIISNVPVLSKSRFVSQPSAELVQKIVATQPALYESPSVPQPSVGRVQRLDEAEPAPPQCPSVPQRSVGRVHRLLGTVLSYETKLQKFGSGSLVRLLYRARYVNHHSQTYELDL